MIGAGFIIEFNGYYSFGGCTFNAYRTVNKDGHVTASGRIPSFWMSHYESILSDSNAVWVVDYI